jgi:hypothetical protein
LLCGQDIKQNLHEAIAVAHPGKPNFSLFSASIRQPSPAFTQQEMPASTIRLTLRSCSKEPKALHPVRKRRKSIYQAIHPFFGIHLFFLLYIYKAGRYSLSLIINANLSV